MKDDVEVVEKKKKKKKKKKTKNSKEDLATRFRSKAIEVLNLFSCCLCRCLSQSLR